MSNLKIAIIGAGTAGLTAAAFLKKSGHNVTLYEKFQSPKPVGAGLMLQPTGLAVLAKLGLDKKLIQKSCPIYTLDGRIAITNKKIFDIAYKDLSPRLFGLGTYRGNLFSVLHDELIRLGVPVITSAMIMDIEYDEQDKPVITSADGQSFGPFDLVIDAQGMNSQLRSKFADIKLDKPYPYAAVWGICKDVDGTFSHHALIQRYVRACHMIGVMPVGKLNGDTCQSVTFFWSLRAKDYAAWCQEDFKKWQDDVVALWPETKPLVEQFEKASDLSFASYKDVILRKWHGNRLAFIGDAAHCTSPQLGQGANMALIDAMVLDECLSKYDVLQQALKAYSKRRKTQLYFYQAASRWLTPFFQSDSKVFPWLRDLVFGLMCRTPVIKTEMLRTMAGLKTNLFMHVNPGKWHKDYDLRRKSSNAETE